MTIAWTRKDTKETMCNTISRTAAILFSATVATAGAVQDSLRSNATRTSHFPAIVSVEPALEANHSNGPAEVQITFDATLPQATAMKGQVIDATATFSFVPVLKDNWKIKNLTVLQKNSASAEFTDVTVYQVIPSACNNYCHGNIRYSIPDLKPGTMLRLQYRVVPRRSRASIPDFLSIVKATEQSGVSTELEIEFVQ